MAQQSINIGSQANDGTGDPLRTAFDKINDNFTEIYTELGGTSLSNITISGNTITTDNSNGALILDPNGTGEVSIVGTLSGSIAGSGQVIGNEASTATNPTLIPYKDDLDTGIGGDGSNSIYMISGGSTILSGTTTAITINTGNVLPASDSSVQSLGSSADKWTNVHAFQGHFDRINITGGSQTTVGSAGAASALPANPTGYVTIEVAGTQYIVPYYAKS